MKDLHWNNRYHDSVLLWKELLVQGLKEDGWPLDWSSLAAAKASGNLPIRAKIIAKSDGVWAGEGLLRAVSSIAVDWGELLHVKSDLVNGDAFKKGAVICEWEGSPQAVMGFERPFLNLATYACSVATTTSKMVALVKETGVLPLPRVAPTRKTLPYYRDISVFAVRVGGGHPHRISLAGGVLLKENHLSTAKGVEPALRAARSVAPHLLKVEVEVKNLKEMDEALSFGADVIMLDNFSSHDAQAAANLTKARMNERKIVLEVSGGINASNIKDYALAGVDVISIGALTHSPTPVDLSLLVQE